LETSLKVKVYKDCYGLPFKAQSINGVYVDGGGLCVDGTVVANTSLTSGWQSGYEFYTGDAISVEGTVIFIGMLCNYCWGHTITDSMAHLWWFHTDEYTTKYSTLPIYYWAPQPLIGNYWEMIRLAGVPMDKLVYLDKLTHFESAIVPDNCFDRIEGDRRIYSKEYSNLIDNIVENATKKRNNFPERVALLRPNQHRQYFCKAMRRILRTQGYSFVDPLHYTVQQQIAIFSQAREIVVEESSMAHNMVFCQNGTKVIILRKCNAINEYQATISQMRNLDVTYVDCHLSVLTRNVLPTEGPFFCYANRQFCQCFNVKYKGFPYKEFNKWLCYHNYFTEDIETHADRLQWEKEYAVIYAKELSQSRAIIEARLKWVKHLPFVPKTIPGFIAQPVTQKTIEQDNSTVLTVSYKRKIITLYIDLKNGVGTSFIQGKFGQDHSVIKEKLSQLQIPNRAGFDLDSEDIYELPDDLSFTLENDETTQISVKWIGGKNTVYTVVILQENLDYKTEDEKYSIYNKIRIDGISGEKTELVTNTINNSVKAGENNFRYTGFTPQEVKNLEINGDASTVIYVYFNRNVTTITYNLNGGNISGNTSSVSISGKYGATVTNIPSDIEREGCSSYVWDKTITKFQPTDTTINAVWTGKNYTVTYHNGSQTEQKEYTYLKDYMVPSLSDFSTLTLEDGGFSGWKLNENDDNSTFFTGNSFTLPEPKNYDLYADIETHFYTVKYYLENITDDNYTEDSSEKIYAKPGTTTNFLPVDKTGFSVNTFDQVTVSEDNSSLIEVKYKRNLYTVTFDLQGGVYTTAHNGIKNSTIPSVTKKYGSSYTFNYYDIYRFGYYIREMKWVDNGETVVSFDGYHSYGTSFTISNISKNMNLKLSGTLQTITCTLKNLNGKTVNKDSELFDSIFSFTVESDRKELPELDFNGYEFLGWYADSNLTKKYNKMYIPKGTTYHDIRCLDDYSDYDYWLKNVSVDLYAKWKSSNALTTSSKIVNIGDIVLQDGRVINIPTIEGIEITLTDTQKSNAVGVVTHNMGTAASPNWRFAGRYQDGTKWKNSVNDPKYVRDSSGNDLKDGSWSGKDDGYNGLTYYANQINSSVKYPIWDYVKNYKNKYKVTLKDTYQTQWYVPSITEMTKIYENFDKINLSFAAIDSKSSMYKGLFWSCNIAGNRDYTPVYYFDFTNGDGTKDEVITTWHYVLACHKF